MASKSVSQLRPVHIRLCDPSLLSELRQHFERSGFDVEDVNDDLDVYRATASSDELSTREVLLHLRVWLAMHPDSIEKPTIR